MTIDPETLAAYADGELDPLTAKRVERAIAADPALAAEVDRHRALTAKLRGAFAGLDAQPMPAGVEALLKRNDNVVPFPTRAAKPKPQRWYGALAASLVAGLLLGQLVPRSGGDLGFDGGTAVAQGQLAHALDTQLASATDSGPVRIGITFRDRAGALCRTFEQGTTGGIACAQGRQPWRIEQLRGGMGGNGGTAYAQAGSPMATLMTDAQAMAAGEPLDAAAEAAALKGR